MHVDQVRLVFKIVLLASLVSSSTLYSDQPGKPVGIKAKFFPAQSSRSVNLTLHCYAIDKFTNGVIYLVISPDSSATADSIVLWNGRSNSETFQKSFDRSFNYKKGRKSFVKAVFKCQFVGETKMHISEESYFLLPRADTILVDRLSYGGLEDREIRYELWKGGYDNLRDDQLRIINPKLWKRLKKSRGQIRND